MRLLVVIIGILILRYFVPFVYVNDVDFERGCMNFDKYYEKVIDSLGNETEYAKLIGNDSIISVYHYNFIYKPDSSWVIPIRARISELQEKINLTKDKEEKKRLQEEINWLVLRYGI